VKVYLLYLYQKIKEHICKENAFSVISMSSEMELLSKHRLLVLIFWVIEDAINVLNQISEKQ